jgi:membrane-associated progesterone receptor component
VSGNVLPLVGSLLPLLLPSTALTHYTHTHTSLLSSGQLIRNMSEAGTYLDQIPPEVLAEVKPGKISLADLFGNLQDSFWADYESLRTEEYQQRMKEDGFSALYQSLNEGNLVLMSLCAVSTILVMIYFQDVFFGSSRDDVDEEEEEEERTPPRDFTIEQLREFDGVNNEKVYIAMRGEVFDVSDAKDFYGVDGSYHCFAGRDASRAMAKLSFDEEELCNQNLDDLGIFERDVLQNWIDKFKYGKQYPIVGHLSFPDVGESKRVFSVEELAKYKGEPAVEASTSTGDDEEVKKESPLSPQELPPGRIHKEILMCVRGKVFDVSYGGVEMYGAGGPYHIFAGIDASRALAKMSFDKSDLASRDLSDLTESQVKVLDDWEKKYIESKKYPVVGVMEDADEAASAALYVIPENMRKTKKAAQ